MGRSHTQKGRTIPRPKDADERKETPRPRPPARNDTLTPVASPLAGEANNGGNDKLATHDRAGAALSPTAPRVERADCFVKARMPVPAAPAALLTTHHGT